MAEFDIALNIRALDGSLVLALEDEANGYWIRGDGLPAEERRWRRNPTSSPWVDGTGTGGPSTKDEIEVSVLVKVFGPTWASVEGRVQALENATEATSWLLEQVVEGVTKVWRAGEVDLIKAPISTTDLLNKRRFIVLTFPVQPTPTVTGI